jgi:hypothetical protein
MTWRSFFNVSTMEHRHLLMAYAVVLLVQAGFFAWIGLNWLRLKRSRD